jgi:hypothetical protein
MLLLAPGAISTSKARLAGASAARESGQIGTKWSGFIQVYAFSGISAKAASFGSCTTQMLPLAPPEERL